MLFSFLDKMVDQISKLDVKASLDEFVEHTLAQYPGLQSSPPATRTLCELALKAIKTMPELIRALRRTADDPRTPPALRLMILSSLAYLVQTRDIIPDDAPGGYGLIDDCALLYATAREVNQRGERNKKLDDQAVMGMTLVSLCLPPERRALLQEAVNGVGAVFQAIEQLPTEALQTSSELIIQNPLVTDWSQRASAAPPSQIHLPDADTHITSRSLPGGRYINTEGDSVSVGFAGGGGATMVGKDIVVW